MSTRSASGPRLLDSGRATGPQPSGTDHDSAPQKQSRPDIEGLRAVAVSAVVLFHAAVPGLGGGFVGVDVFFVISGFLITGLLWREVDGTGTVKLRGFYGARARRLLPASAAVGVVTSIAAAVLLPPFQAREALGDGIVSALYIGNYRLAMRDVDYFAGGSTPSPFQHYWSLGVEEQYYVLWPVLIIITAWVTRRTRRRGRAGVAASRRPYAVVLAVGSAVSFAFALGATYWSPSLAFFFLPTRAWQLGLGGLVALSIMWWRRLPAGAAAITGWVGLAMILLACVLLSGTTRYPGVAALLPTVGAALVIGAGCATPTQGCGRVLGLRPMRAIGRVSYSWYLWHWPVLVLVPIALGHSLGLVGRVTLALLSGLLAVPTVRYIENPVRFAAPLRRSALDSLAVGAVATAVAACVGVGLLRWVPPPAGQGAPIVPMAITVAPVPAGAGIEAYDAAVRQAFDKVRAVVEASAPLEAVPSNLQPSLADASAEFDAMSLHGCMRTFFQWDQPECVVGDRASTTRVALIGDSNAAMWNPAFEEVADQRHWRLQMFAKAGCPMMDLPIAHPLRRQIEHFEHCGQWRSTIMDRLRAERPQLVVVSMWRRYIAEHDWWMPNVTSYDPAWNASVTGMVQELRAIGVKVLVLGPVPDPVTEVANCLANHLDNATFCMPSRSVAVNQSGIDAESAATRRGGGQYTDLTGLFCTSERCPLIVGNTMVYLDQGHVTFEYARELAPALGALADRALAYG